MSELETYFLDHTFGLQCTLLDISAEATWKGTMWNPIRKGSKLQTINYP